MAHDVVGDFTGPAKSAGWRHSVTLAALGVVYGDIGTSPLYAVKQSLVDFGGQLRSQESHAAVRDRPAGREAIWTTL